MPGLHQADLRIEQFLLGVQHVERSARTDQGFLAHAAGMPQPAVEPPADSSLVGAAVAGAATSAFARLNRAVQDSVPPPAAHDPGPSVGGQGKTVEDLVKEMLRPMLKEWLDRNLPPMVERYVEREIVRLTRR